VVWAGVRDQKLKEMLGKYPKFLGLCWNLMELSQNFSNFVEKFKPGKPGNFREMARKHPRNSWILDLENFNNF